MSCRMPRTPRVSSPPSGGAMSPTSGPSSRSRAPRHVRAWRRCRPRRRPSIGSRSGASTGPARPAWWPGPATRARKAWSAPFPPRWRSTSGTPSWARVSSRRAWARRDTLRLEAGLPLHGHELGPGITPLQAGLGWVIGWDKGDFTGRAALEEERANGPARRLRGFVADGRQPLRDGSLLCEGVEQVGILTSGNFSPMRERGIGLGFVDADARLLDGDAITHRPARPGAPGPAGATAPVARSRRERIARRLVQPGRHGGSSRVTSHN